DTLKRWKSAHPPITDGHPVTLRWLLSMRAGVNVPGFGGYPIDAALPTLTQILEGRAPATSPPVEVIREPAEHYAYSGGGYEIIEALVEDATGRPFAEVARSRVLDPVGMTSSTFDELLPSAIRARAAHGHFADGQEVPGGWRVLPERAAAGLWSTPIDLATLLVSIFDAYAGRPGILRQETVREMLMPQEGGPYGLGAAVSGADKDSVLMKRGQNVGYQGYLILYPAHGQGMVVMSGSDNGSTLSDALIRRAGEVYGWPSLGRLED